MKKTHPKITNTFKKLIFVIVVYGSLDPSGAWAQVTPPDLSVCDNQTCDTLESSYCSSGFEVSLFDYKPASSSQNGVATFTYKVCSPAAGLCSSGPVTGGSCLDDSQCSKKCQNNGTCQVSGTSCTTDADCSGTCDRNCAVDKFYALSHFDVGIPALGGVDSCLTENNEIHVTCSSGTASYGQDGSCGGFFSAKCDSPNLAVGDCLTMTVEIAGEQSGIGLGTAILIDKESTSCTAECGFGPSCDPCEEDHEGEACLTRTIGFWGNHPWITNDYDTVTVCGKTLGCDDIATDNSACSAKTCSSVIEGLCSNPSEFSTNQPYVSMVRQLTAAKLNLNASLELAEGTCSTWSYQGKTIQQWISYCESLCGANKTVITNSGCIEAMDVFNNSQDTGFDQVPEPFDQPSLNDNGSISGADPSQCHLAKGGKGSMNLVIGKKIGSVNCQ